MDPSQNFFALRVKKVCFIGAGFVGGPTAAVLATHVPEIDVVVVDINVTRIAAWNSDTLPISEPGLLELVEQCRGPSSLSIQNHDRTESIRKHNLRFTQDVEGGIRGADMIFLAVDTSQSHDEHGETTLDLTNLKQAVSKVGETAASDFIIVEKSTVPCGTARLLHSILSKTLRPGIAYEILSNPEFLAEGTAVQDLLEPDRVLIGTSQTPHGLYAAQLLREIYECWVPRERVFTMDTWSSELAKLCANAFLAQRVSSINSISMVCEKIGADVNKIAQAVKTDRRIGSQMLNPSVGFGGSCFQKDITHLVYLARGLGLEQVAQYWQAVLAINQAQKTSFAKRISQRLATLPNTHTHTKIGVLGFTFKAETNDVRESPAIDVVKHLIGRHYDVRIYDPRASEADILRALGLDNPSSKQEVEHCLQISASPYHACKMASAIVILTEWKDFEYQFERPTTTTSATIAESGTDELRKDSHSNNGNSSSDDSDKQTLSSESASDSPVLQSSRLPSPPPGSQARGLHSPSPLDWPRIARAMAEPRYLFDGRNIVDDAVGKYGFQIERIGRA